MGGNDIYSSTKAAQEIMVNSFYKSYFQNKKNLYNYVKGWQCNWWWGLFIK